MNDTTRILNLLSEGKISVEEAEKLLNAIKNVSEEEQTAFKENKHLPKYLYIKVDDKKGDNVDIKIPLALLKSGIKIASLIPDKAKNKINSKMHEKGLDFDINNMSKKDMEEMLYSLSEMEIKVNGSKGTDNVRIFCGA